MSKGVLFGISQTGQAASREFELTSNKANIWIEAWATVVPFTIRCNTSTSSGPVQYSTHQPTEHWLMRGRTPGQPGRLKSMRL
jgi:hypothetical protein